MTDFARQLLAHGLLVWYVTTSESLGLLARTCRESRFGGVKVQGPPGTIDVPMPKHGLSQYSARHVDADHEEPGLTL